MDDGWQEDAVIRQSKEDEFRQSPKVGWMLLKAPSNLNKGGGNPNTEIFIFKLE